MSESLVLLIAAALSLVGMAWMALSMDVHWGQVMHGSAPAATGTRRVLRVLGVVALLMSALACLHADRPSMAVLVWVMFLSGSALSVAMLLAYRARWLRWCWPCAA